MPPRSCSTFLALALLPAASCVTVERSTRIGAAVRAYPVAVKAVYEVRSQGRPVGRVRLLEVRAGPRTERWYEVARSDGQVVGRIDLLGRAFRLEPFREGWVLVSMDGMEEDLRVLLELPQRPRIARAEVRPRSTAGGRPVEAAVRLRGSTGASGR